MKLKISLLALCGALGACAGAKPAKKEAPPQRSEEAAEAEEADMATEFKESLLAGGDTGTSSTEAPEVDADTKVVLETIHAAMQALNLEIAECADFLDEAKALQAAEKELKASFDKGEKLDKKAVEAKLQPLHEALRAKVEASGELKTCLVDSRGSDEAVTVKTLVEACFELPEAPAEGDRRPSPPGRLPPKDAAQFDSDECKAAVESTK